MKYIVFTIFFPFFSIAWLVANVLHLSGREDMPTPFELIEELKTQESGGY